MNSGEVTTQATACNDISSDVTSDAANIGPMDVTTPATNDIANPNVSNTTCLTANGVSDTSDNTAICDATNTASNVVLAAMSNGVNVNRTSPKKRSKKRKFIKSSLKSLSRCCCQVCGHESNKRFCGTMCCVNCKNFYRQAAVSRQMYVCSAKIKHQCKVTFNSESMPCKKCHLRKCESKGMNRLIVKVYRPVALRRLPTKTPKTVKHLVEAYFRIFRCHEKKLRSNDMNPLLLSDCALEKPGVSYKAAMFSKLCTLYEPIVNHLVRFSSLIPGFSALPPDDQLILLKTGFIDVWLVLNAPHLALVQDSVTLSDGTQIPICEFTTVYTKDYVTSLMELSDEYRTLKLLPYDRAVLIALVLACPDRPNLIAVDQVKDLRESLLSSFTQFIHLVRPRNTTLSDKVNSILSSIYNIGKQHALLMNMYRAEIDQLAVTPVITELFDLHPSHTYKESNKELGKESNKEIDKEPNKEPSKESSKELSKES